MFVPVSVDNTQSQSEQQRENENNIRISGTPQTQKAELLLLDDFFDTTVSD
jgi:predicted amidophosphoribosyltransferase